MKKIKDNIIAHGESGHVHRLLKTEVSEREDGVRIFDVENSDIVKHDEHKEIVLPAEKYASDKVIEFDHFSEEAKRVKD